jgi:hypothetical protein
MGLMIEGDQRAGDRLAGCLVVGDGGGQGQNALANAGHDPGRGAPAVVLQGHLSLEGVVD